MLKRRIKLQLFASLDDIITGNADAFKDSNVKESYDGIAAKLGELGYDVLINNKKQAEYVPASRLNEIIGQRDTARNSINDLTKQLEALQKNAGADQKLKDEIQGYIDSNAKLIKDLDNLKIQAEIFAVAKDAINAKDLMAFINMDNVKLNAKGEVVGVEAEVARLKTEKAYLFNAAPDGGAGKKKKFGTDNNDNDDNKGASMNAMIRRAAGRS